MKGERGERGKERRGRERGRCEEKEREFKKGCT